MAVLDTYAWIEYFEGSEKGEIVKDYVDSNKEIFTPSICLAEIKISYIREKKDYRKRIKFVINRSSIVNLNKEISLLSAENKIKYKLYLVDSIIYSTAQFLNKKIITGDKHFEKLDNVIFLSNNENP